MHLNLVVFFTGGSYTIPDAPRSAAVCHIQGIKLIRSGALYSGNQPHCPLDASYPRALS